MNVSVAILRTTSHHMHVTQGPAEMGNSSDAHVNELVSDPNVLLSVYTEKYASF